MLVPWETTADSLIGESKTRTLKIWVTHRHTGKHFLKANIYPAPPPPPNAAQVHVIPFCAQRLWKTDVTCLNGPYGLTTHANKRYRKPLITLLSKLFSVAESASRIWETLAHFSLCLRLSGKLLPREQIYSLELLSRTPQVLIKGSTLSLSFKTWEEN